ncbi:MAG: deoxyribodipyrimidine photo-lyase/cryptochrome family protein [Thiolinea sp.]
MKPSVHIVWFKRDLRVHDHAPLKVAASRGTVLPLYVVEPEYWTLPDTSARQWQFMRQSLNELNTALVRLGQGLVKMQGTMTEVLSTLKQHYTIAGLYSHQESGNQWTFERDKQVGCWCQQHSIEWQEFQLGGVVRRLQDRDGWAGHWEHFMQQERVLAPTRLAKLSILPPQQRLPDQLGTALEASEATQLQTGGRREALSLLGSFLRERGHNYSYEMSSPLSATQSCSRLSPHLAYGTVSVREVTQKMRNVLEYAGLDTQWKRSLRSFDARLHWHCHFIQKLETDIRFETEHMIPAFQGMRETEFNDAYFEAWKSGMTGFPFIDACMRSLRQTGWINFRMRAMLVSFAAYQLWLHWQKPAWHLAQCFTDYEPGIHYCQIQMQSGTSGINALRMYNPVKQSQDQDAQGIFIRRWLPELARVPTEFIHEPWGMPWSLQQEIGCIIGTHYPEPIVDHMQAVRHARARFSELRKHHPDFQAQAKALNEKHGSRRKQRGKKRPSPTANTQQMELF